MIFKDSLESLIEAVYLKETPTDRLGRADVFVNPKGSIDYLVRKAVIYNTNEFPEETIVKKLLNLGNTLIFRTLPPYKDLPVLFCPYILRVEFGIRWNGEEETLSGQPIGDWFGSVEGMEVGTGDISLFLPKILDPKPEEIQDEHRNLTVWGYALQEVGINIHKQTKFTDLDVIKTKKTHLRRPENLI